jgi:hypothetical protein
VTRCLNCYILTMATLEDMGSLQPVPLASTTRYSSTTSLAHPCQYAMDFCHRRASSGIHSPTHPYYLPKAIAHHCRLGSPKYTVMPMIDDLDDAIAVRMWHRRKGWLQSIRLSNGEPVISKKKTKRKNSLLNTL